MAENRPPRESVGPIAWRCLQLLGCLVGSVGVGNSISAGHVAFAPPATVLQIRMVNGGRGSAAVRRTINGAYEYFRYRGYCRSYCDALALRSSTLREETRRS